MNINESEDFRDHYEYFVEVAARHIEDHLSETPELAITLGSGLGDLAQAMNIVETIDYEDIPNFPTPTVSGHAGKLHIGKLKGVPIIGLQGRKHYYEVADEPTGMLQVAFPVHVMANLGIPIYFGTNAVGGLRAHQKVGKVMVVKDQINFLPNPLLGRRHDFTRLDGDKVFRFQPMAKAYNTELSDILFGSAFGESFMTEGIYLGVTGPTYETAAEVRAFRSMGADTVGMSLTPEVIIATNRGMETLGLNVVTNVVANDGTNATSHEEVVEVLESPGQKARLVSLVSNFFDAYRNSEFRYQVLEGVKKSR